MLDWRSRAALPSTTLGGMSDHRSPELDALIRSAERAAAKEPDLVDTAAAVIKLAIGSGADPYLLIGALIEGVAATIDQRVPAQCQGITAVQTVRILLDRLKAHGVI